MRSIQTFPRLFHEINAGFPQCSLVVEEKGVIFLMSVLELNKETVYRLVLLTGFMSYIRFFLTFQRLPQKRVFKSPSQLYRFLQGKFSDVHHSLLSSIQIWATRNRYLHILYCLDFCVEMYSNFRPLYAQFFFKDTCPSE